MFVDYEFVSLEELDVPVVWNIEDSDDELDYIEEMEVTIRVAELLEEIGYQLS